jgi:hypothetical protein
MWLQFMLDFAAAHREFTDAKLAPQREAAQAYIKTLKDEILALKAKIKPAWQGQRLANNELHLG